MRPVCTLGLCHPLADGGGDEKRLDAGGSVFEVGRQSGAWEVSTAGGAKVKFDPAKFNHRGFDWSNASRLGEPESVLYQGGSEREYLLMHAASLQGARAALTFNRRKGQRPGVALDFGCGTGRILRFFGKKGGPWSAPRSPWRCCAPLSGMAAGTLIVTLIDESPSPSAMNPGHDLGVRRVEVQPVRAHGGLPWD